MGNLLTCCDSERPTPPEGQDNKRSGKKTWGARTAGEEEQEAGADGARAGNAGGKGAKGSGAAGAGDGDLKPKLKGAKWKKLKSTVRNKESMKELKDK